MFPHYGSIILLPDVARNKSLRRDLRGDRYVQGTAQLVLPKRGAPCYAPVLRRCMDSPQSPAKLAGVTSPTQ
jgi:hypothetical protein